MDKSALRALRGDASQSEFAARLGIAREYLSRMENGHAEPGPAVRARAALLRIVRRLEGNDKALAVELRAMAEEGLSDA